MKRTSPTDPAPKGPTNSSGTLLRGLDVLEVFGPGRDVLGNADISAATGLPKATVTRLTRALVEAGYLEYEPQGGKYRLRPRVLTLGFSFLSNVRFLPMAHDRLQRLATASGCAVSLAWPDAPHMIYLDRCSGDAMPYYFSVGSTIDMACTATGQAYLAALDPADRADLCARLADRHGDDWPALQAAIERAVDAVAANGFCLVDATWRPNIRGIAAPLVSRDGRLRLSINCVAQTFAMDRETLTGEWGPALAALAQGLCDHL